MLWARGVMRLLLARRAWIDTMVELEVEEFSSASFASDSWHDFWESTFVPVIDVLIRHGCVWDIVEFESVPHIAILLVEKSPSYIGAFRVIRYPVDHRGEHGSVFMHGKRYNSLVASKERVAEQEEFLEVLDQNLSIKNERPSFRRN
jgi:hypothetical protein